MKFTLVDGLTIYILVGIFEPKLSDKPCMNNSSTAAVSIFHAN